MSALVASTAPVAMTDPTLPPTPEPDALATEAPRRRRRRWPWVVLAVALLVAGGLIASAFITLDTYRQGPGSIYRAQDRVSVSGAPEFRDDMGIVDETTVSFSRTTVLDKIIQRVRPDPAVEFVDPQQFLQGRPPDENRKINLALMDDSKQKASAVALRKLGYDVTLKGKGAVVTQVSEGSPAAGKLAPDDIVTEANGQPIGTGDDLVAVVRASKPGDTLTLTVSTVDGPTRTETVTVAARPDNPEVGFLGVSLQTRDPELDLPVDVKIDSGGVGGPSAGLAFTLAILDVMTPGNLTGGTRVCTTGTINLDGTVGPIGGVRQKSAVCQRGGAKVFLVPPDNAEEARRYSDGMQVVPVASLDDALAAIAAVGGDTAPVTEAAAARK